MDADGYKYFYFNKRTIFSGELIHIKYSRLKYLVNIFIPWYKFSYLARFCSPYKSNSGQIMMLTYGGEATLRQFTLIALPYTHAAGSRPKHAMPRCLPLPPPSPASCDTIGQSPRRPLHSPSVSSKAPACSFNYP